MSGAAQSEGEAALERVLAGAAAVAALLWEKGWAEGNAGNLSCDVTDLVPEAPSRRTEGPARPLPVEYAELGGRRVLVTESGSRMRDLAREPGRFCGILHLAPGGDAYALAWPGAGVPFAPTSELPSHLAIHAALRRLKSRRVAIVHTHPTELLALSHDAALQDEARLNRALWAVHPELALLLPEGLGLVRYLCPGTAQQGVAAGAAMERHRVALWEKHGAVAVGADFAEAFDRIDTVNKAARLLLLCRAAGYEPQGLTAAQLEELRGAAGAGGNAV